MFKSSETDTNTGLAGQDVELCSSLLNPDIGLWELIFDSIPDMVALIDLNYTIVKANKALLQKLDLDQQSIIGNTCSAFFHENGCAIEQCTHLQMLKDRKPHSVEIFDPKFGCYLNFTTTPIFDADGNLLGSLHIVRDISLQKESEAKLIEYNKELKELSLNKDKFFSIVAHDLRSPFQGMLGFTELILDELDTLSKEEIKEYLQKVRDSSYSTFSLLENLLDWSRMQTGRLQFNPSRFSINEEITAIISLLDSNARSKNIRIFNKLTKDYLVLADQHMVHSILLNLTSNAIKFTHKDGKIIFDAVLKYTSDNHHEGGQSNDYNYLEISISDTGVGISQQQQARLFNIDDNFTLRGTANEQGAGLGLILVKEMTEKHCGKLTINSLTGIGSVFSFTLPLSEL